MNKLTLPSTISSQLNSIVERLIAQFPVAELEAAGCVSNMGRGGCNCGGGCQGSCSGNCGGCGGSSCKGGLSLF